VDDLWDALYEYGAEIVMNGHEHIYERYQPLDANDSVDNAYGIREFIVGTGGKSITSEMRPPSPTSVTRNLSDLGVLKLYLQADGYSWEFVPVAGGSYADSGSSSVHSAPSQLVTQAPVLSPGSGVYAESVSVTMSSSTPGASIYYTIDGTVPDTNSTLYAGAITLTSTTTVKAMAAAAGLADSTVTTGDYVVQPAPTQTESPIFTPASGTYQDSVSVAIISSTPGASIYYTTDGTVPDTNSTLYAGAIVLTSDTTVKALATAGGLIDSRVATALYTIQTGGGQSATIVLEPIADTYVKANRATSNYGARDWLEIDGYSVKISYLKFDLSSIPAGSTVTSAVLKLTVIDSSISTQVVKLVDDSSWEELLLTYENRPTGSTLLASIPGASVGDVISISLTNIVNTEQGSLFSLLIDSDGSNGLDVSSRDAAAGRPVLEITYE
jgi:hypothetical protein